MLLATLVGPRRPRALDAAAGPVLALLAALAAAAPLAAQRSIGPVLDFDRALAMVTDLDALWRAPVAGERCVQFSSHDRRSEVGPGDPEAWYANGDRGQYLRSVERDGRTEHVMADAAGPGVVVRIWSANPAGTLRFYVDGEQTPRWTVGFAALLGGELPGLGEPWCGLRARGANCHLPIPFAKRIEITTDAGDLYYHVNLRHLPAGTAVESFDPDWLESRREAIATAGRRLAAPTAAELPEVARAEQGTSGVLWATRFQGPGVLRMLRLGLRSGADAEAGSRAALHRSVRLRIVCDGEPSVDVPFADFFGSAPALAAWSGLALGVQADGSGWCSFPMPCASSLAVELVADAALPAALHIAASQEFASTPIPDDALRFAATWQLALDRRTRPRSDHRVLDVAGAGRYVGTTLCVRNPTRAWWGEGDEKIYVDDERYPSTFGTGTEDYFGYAWCCPELFDHPLHAQPQADGPANFGYVCNVRLHVADAIPFRERLRFELELWHWEDVVVDYATVAYCYVAPGARVAATPMPDVAARLPRAMEPPLRFVAAGVLEGEELAVLERSGGSTQVQDLHGFASSRWSRDAHLWWTGASPGDRLVLRLPVAAPGRYRLQAALTTAPDYGRVRLGIDGEPLGDEIDLYSKAVASTGLVELGSAELSGGEARLSIEITGRNPDAVPRHMFGLDYVKLVPEER